MSVDNGGPAFPQRFENESQNDVEFFGTIKAGKFMQFGGVTMRDYFAAKAMQAIVTGMVSKGEGTETEELDIVSKASYLVADAMLKARRQ